MKNVMVMLIPVAIALSTFAQSEEIDGVVWRYKLTSDEFGVMLTGNSTSDLSAIPRSTKGVVVLPSWIGDCPVVEIDQDAFYGCKYLTDINATDDNLYFTSIDGVVYDYDVTVLVRCPQGKTSVSIPYGVTEIAAGAFAGCAKLEQIELPETLRHIRGDAYCGCVAFTRMGNVAKLGMTINCPDRKRNRSARALTRSMEKSQASPQGAPEGRRTTERARHPQLCDNIQEWRSRHRL